MITMIKGSVLAVAILVLGTAQLGAQPRTGATLPAPVAPGVNHATGENGAGPRIKFAMQTYDFGRARAGDPVKYNFVFTNIGDQVLEVTAVNPGCGCTTVGDWTKRVDPGKTGVIPIQFNSAGYPAGAVQKHPSVVCNDRTQPTVSLQLVGTLWKAIDVSPAYAIINVPPDARTASTTVHITNNMDDSITITGLESNNRQFKADLKTNQPGKDFVLTITALGPFSPGTTQSQITFRTSSTNMSSETITCMAIVPQTVVVSPPQISLPQAPLANALTNSFSIQNRSTNAIHLSEPAINAKDVEIRVEEAQPGRLFNVLVSFPRGFDAQGQSVVVTFKSNLPQSPVIKVPVVQASRPVTPPTTAQRMNPNPAVYLEEMRSRLAVAEAGEGLLRSELQRLTVEKAELEGRFNDLSAVETQIARLKGKSAVRERPEASLEERGGQKLLTAASPNQARGSAPTVAASQALQPANQQAAVRIQSPSPNPSAQILDVQKRLTAAEGEKARLQKELQQTLRAKMELEAQFNSLAALGTQASKLKKEIAAAQHLEWVRQGGSGAADEKGGQRLVQALSASQAETKTSTPNAVKAPGPESANRPTQ
jgi:hypothetical protein